MYEELTQKLQKHQQTHLLKFIDELDEQAKQELISQLEAIDFDELDNLIEKYVNPD